ncbi:aminoglycoside phosphotransferase family protein [Aliikangiella coralliicola]|uniref:Phosphotransferase n=1 Tax=Aliikangiella coralliicola TaxID=2592383 RepID=A0A545UE34_9GAMM|nr:phosphotransferase [Aliikangiella coralliicola]TQV87721.1 phosphotransferase [Aliikangiella coralliicola]
MIDQRKQQLAHWAGKQLNQQPPELETVSGDASFRRYFRFSNGESSIIAVDAPPTHEDNHSFHRVAKILLKQGLLVPEFLNIDFDEGFILLSDLGDKLYLPSLNQSSVNQLYSKAIDSIIQMQQIPLTNLAELTTYDEQKLNMEMALFPDWFIKEHLKLQLSDTEKKLISDTFRKLADNALAQPQYFVHRDYHSRNLMICERQTPGIIDFQDAVIGPITYDLVSLLKDCYIEWEEAAVKSWCEEYLKQAKTAGLTNQEFSAFYKDFEWMGMQRHIKVLGIFARLNYRDNKPGYLQDLPLTLNYLRKAAARYDEFREFSQFLEQRISPAMAKI